MAWIRSTWSRVRAWLAGLLKASLTPKEVGWAVGVGVFIGILPAYGLHLPLCVLAARQLRLNQVITYTAAQVSNPVFAPFLVYAEIALGEWLRYGAIKEEDTHVAGHVGLQMLQEAPDLFVSCLVGSLVLGIVAAPLIGGAAALLFRWRQNRRNAA